MIQRECLGRLAKWREKPPAKVLAGVRGSGKTTLLAMYIDWLKRSGAGDSQIVFVDLEALESAPLLDFRALYSHIKKRLCPGRFTYVFIDEAQRCPQCEKAAAALLAQKQVDLYVSTSAAGLSVAPQVEIRVLPLSFAEYLLFSKARGMGALGADYVADYVAGLHGSGLRGAGLDGADLGGAGLHGAAFPAGAAKHMGAQRLPRQKAQAERYIRQEAFNNYLSAGGFPLAALLGADPALARRCVDGIYSAALLKDAARQPGISDIPLLEQVARLMSLHAGRPLSSKKIGAAISAGGRKISTNTVEAYMKALSAAFVFSHAGRFDIKAGKHLKTLGKYYIADPGLRNLLLEPGAASLASHLENVVYLELLRRGFQVCIGKYGREEISFAAFWPLPAAAGGAGGVRSVGGIGGGSGAGGVRSAGGSGSSGVGAGSSGASGSSGFGFGDSGSSSVGGIGSGGISAGGVRSVGGSGNSHSGAGGNDNGSRSSGFGAGGIGQAYFQVVPSAHDKAALARKLAPLAQIQDNHPKFILTLDETPFRASHNGIIQRNLLDWLLDGKR